MPEPVGRAVIRGGRVFDPDTGVIAPRDLYIEDGRLSPAFVPTAADQAWNVGGALVTPGWVDLHVHVFDGQDLVVNPDRLGPRTGVTAMVDAGSAGAHLFPLFRRQMLEASSHLRAFLNISSIGTTSILLAGECQQLGYVSASECEAVLRANRDILVGVKVRASHNVGGDNTQQAFQAARQVARNADVPLMVHVGPAPMGIQGVLDALEAGDIVTHCFSPHTDRSLVDDSAGGEVLHAVAAARARGVLFDVGHGGGSFDASRTATALRAGFMPDTISTDVHAYVDRPKPTQEPGTSSSKTDDEQAAPSLSSHGLPHVVNKMLALGMRLEDALLRVTARPAAIGGFPRDVAGSLDIGAGADIAVFDILEREVTYSDTEGHSFSGTTHLAPRLTLQRGVAAFERDAAPMA